MASPYELRIRMYNVGFGDCFLLTFRYRRAAEKHVLIDFGSTAGPKGRTITSAQIVADIEKVTGGRLDAVVATHRHADHISGFDPGKTGKGPGARIAAMARNALVVQPWTEDPALPKAARSPAGRTSGAMRLSALHALSLDDMHSVANAVVRRARALNVSDMDADIADEGIISTPVQNGAQNAAAAQQTALRDNERETPEGFAMVQQLGVGRDLRERLSFLGETNLKNLPAVKNLMSMSKRREYLNYGASTALSGTVLPGVKVHVLGPPTIEQYDKVLNQRAKDASEFWHLQAVATHVSEAKTVGKLFPDAESSADLPKSVRWFVRKLRAVQAEQLLELVRIVDDAMNNTSLILLFEAGGKLLLFPGDAQIENWEYALRHAKDRAKQLARLADVEVYKVGHHGSLNATPKTLWKTFGRKGKSTFTTMMSTRSGKHGSPKAQTEVPRATLVAALRKQSNLHCTADLKKEDNGALFEDVVIAL